MLCSVPLAVLLSVSSCVTTRASTVAPQRNETVSPSIHQFMVGALLPKGYNLPWNVYEWNATEIFNIINRDHPTLLPGLDANGLKIFPVPFLQQLPRSFLLSKKMCDYLPVDDPQYCGNGTTFKPNNGNGVISASTCWPPFTDTKFKPVFANCGLRCKYSDVMWGLRDSEQKTIDTWRTLCSICFLLFSVVVVINHGCELRENYFCQTPILFQAPACIAILYLLVAILFILPSVVGPSFFVCREDLGGIRTVTVGNPRGGDTRCTTAGIMLSLALYSIGQYIALFSFGLWKQFYVPLANHDDHCPSLIARCLSRLGDAKLALDLWADTNCKSKVKKNSVVDIYLCNEPLIYHCLIWIISSCFTLAYLTQNAIDGFRPLGTCAHGGNSRSLLLWTAVVPYALFLCLAALFLPLSVYLLVKLRGTSASEAERQVLKKLGFRVMFYFVTILFCWVLIFTFSLVFYQKREEIVKRAQSSLTCIVLNSSNPNKCIEGTTVSISVYVLMFVSTAIAGLGSCVLSCRSSVWRKWQKCLPVGAGIMEKLKLYHSTSNVNTNSREGTGATMTQSTQSSSGKSLSDGNKQEVELCVTNSGLPPESTTLPFERVLSMSDVDSS